MGGAHELIENEHPFVSIQYRNVARQVEVILIVGGGFAPGCGHIPALPLQPVANSGIPTVIGVVEIDSVSVSCRALVECRLLRGIEGAVGIHETVGLHPGHCKAIIGLELVFEKIGGQFSSPC